MFVGLQMGLSHYQAYKSGAQETNLIWKQIWKLSTFRNSRSSRYERSPEKMYKVKRGMREPSKQLKNEE